MSEIGSEEPTSVDGRRLDDLLNRLTEDSRLSKALNPADGAWLVLDEGAGRILRASPSAKAVARAIADSAGTVAPALRLADQVRPMGLPRDRPTLARIRFDQRRIGPPSTCLILRASLDDGGEVLIVAFADRPPALRPLPRLDTAEDVPPPTPSAPAPEEATATDQMTGPATPRFVWRSDADDVVTFISGPAGGTVRPAMKNRSWTALTEAQVIADGDGLLVALAARKTFRAIPVTLRIGGSLGAVDLELSGAPVARAGDGFQGFNGFGLVRPSLFVPEPDLDDAFRTDVAAETDDRPSEPQTVMQVSDAPPAALVVPTPLPPTPLPPTPLPPAPLPPTEEDAQAWRTAAPDLSVAHGDEAPPHESIEHDAPATVAIPEPPARDPRLSSHDPHLSSNEHAAFREIARALGARFAGDDEPEVAPVQHVAEARMPSGSVMLFPTSAMRLAETAPEPDAAVVATLERLPSGVLVYRDGKALFANRPLLDLAGFDDLSALDAAGGIARLFGGLAPHERASADAPAILTTRDGGTRGVDLQRSVIDWRGAPAELLLVRDAAFGEPARLETAARIAQDFAVRRAADALAVLDSLDDGIVTLDRTARIIGLNRRAAEVFGLDPREIVGASILALFAPESAVDVLASVHGVPGPADTMQRDARPIERQVMARGTDGVVSLGLTVIPLDGGEDGRLAALIRVGTSVRTSEAEETTARRAAEFANARKSDFLAKISHEIRTPMNGILGFADLMLAEPFGPVGHPRYRDYLGDIHASGTHVLSLVNDLLDLAKIEAGRLDLTFAEVPLNEIVSSCVALMQPQAARERVVVRTSFSNDLTTLVADERSVRQAALNVIANAIQFTEAGGQVIVSTIMADRGEIALRVRDTGIGMTPDEVAIALEPFRQVAVSGARKGKVGGKGGGTGLGLPLTKALVEANHGRFRITSRKDEGTLVEMLFPPHPVTLSA